MIMVNLFSSIHSSFFFKSKMHTKIKIIIEIIVIIVLFFFFLGTFLDKAELNYLLNKCIDSENESLS